MAKRTSHGFTLLELMVTVALVGVIATIAGPNLIYMRDTLRAGTAVSEINSMVRLGKSGAQGTGKRQVMVIYYGATGTASDDRITLFSNAPTAGIDVTTISLAALDGTALPPAQMGFVRRADLATNIGVGPTTGYPGGAFTFPYANVPHGNLCTFCVGRGAVYFEPDGRITLTDGSVPGNQPVSGSGSLSISPEGDWGVRSNRIYAISFIGQTGVSRVWKQ